MFALYLEISLRMKYENDHGHVRPREGLKNQTSTTNVTLYPLG